MTDFLRKPPEDHDLVYRPLYGCVGDVATQEDIDRLRPNKGPIETMSPVEALKEVQSLLSAILIELEAK